MGARVKFGIRAMAVVATMTLILAAQRADAQNDAPWPRLPDGRVVIEIHGHRLAFEPNLPVFPGRLAQSEVQFFAGPENPQIFFHDVLANPARARAAFAAARRVAVRFQNIGHGSGRFLGRFSRDFLPATNVFLLNLHADRSETACRFGSRYNNVTYQRMCERVAELAQNPPALDEEGFIVAQQLYSIYTLYVFPASERLAATGEPVFFGCFRAGPQTRSCRSAVGHLADGYFVRPGAQLLYEFSEAFWPQSTWRNVDARFRAVVDDVLLPEAGARPSP